MVTKKFKQEFLVTPLATARVLEEMIPKETDAKALKEIIKFASHLAVTWGRMWMLAEKRLEVIEEIKPIVCQTRGDIESPSK